MVEDISWDILRLAAGKSSLVFCIDSTFGCMFLKDMGALYMWPSQQSSTPMWHLKPWRYDAVAPNAPQEKTVIEHPYHISAAELRIFPIFSFVRFDRW